MSRKDTPQDADPTVTDGIGPEADEETLARIREADEANIKANEAPDGEGRVGIRVGAIATTAEKNSLANKYATDCPYGAIFTADPGTSGAATGEVTGGSPAYARVGISWGSASSGVVTGSATFNVPSGTTVTYAGVATSGTATTADVKDRIAITSQNFATQGTLTVTFTYTQS